MSGEDSGFPLLKHLQGWNLKLREGIFHVAVFVPWVLEGTDISPQLLLREL